MVAIKIGATVKLNNDKNLISPENFIGLFAYFGLSKNVILITYLILVFVFKWPVG